MVGTDVTLVLTGDVAAKVILQVLLPELQGFTDELSGMIN